MRAKRVIGCSVVVAILTLVIWSLLSSGRSPLPPALRLVTVERAGILDDEGAEMWLATLSISNANSPFPGRNGVFFVKSDDQPGEMKSTQQWTEVERPWVEGQLRGQMQTFQLTPGMERQRLMLLPSNARSCRISLSYVYAVTSCRTRIAGAVQRMPRWIRSHVPFKFWRWAGVNDPLVPGSDWRPVTAELSFTAVNAN